MVAIVMRPITLASVSIADPILIQAYNSGHSFQAELEYYLRLQPDGWFFVMDDETPVGVGGVMNYGAFAYIGLIAVSPTMQRRGVGRLLMEYLLDWLTERGCSSARLVATNSGASLYSKLGFIQDDVTVAYRLDDLAQLAMLRKKITKAGKERILMLRAEDLEELVAFDTPIFGGSRRTVLASYLEAFPERCFITRAKRSGRITGYIVAQQDALGPWIAQTPVEGEALLLHALALPFEQAPAVRTHTSHTAAVHILTKYGFSERRIFKHMYHGSKEPLQQKDQLYALASSALG